MKVLCVFGKYQYGEPARGVGTEFAAFIPAFKSLGCEVVHFESWNRGLYENFSDLNRSLLSVVEKEKPDVFLAVQMGYEIWIETLQVIRAMGRSAMICWTTDDSWKYREFSRFVGKYYHAMTTTYESVIPAYKKDGIKNVLLTQWAAGSNFLKIPLPAAECRYAVTFIGMAHGDRKKRVARLKKNGIDVTCFGHGWENGSLEVGEVFNVFRNSQICINFGNSKGVNQIKARNFEVPGAGGFLVTEAAPGLEKYFKIPGEIETFQNLGELSSKIKYYLEHPGERDQIARAGNIRVRRDHTYEMRMKEVLEFAVQVRKNGIIAGGTNGLKFTKAVERHKINYAWKTVRAVLVGIFSMMFGPDRAPRAARRLLYEVSWRFCGERTYSAGGIPGRLFYHERRGKY